MRNDIVCNLLDYQCVTVTVYTAYQQLLISSASWLVLSYKGKKNTSFANICHGRTHRKLCVGNRIFFLRFGQIKHASPLCTIDNPLPGFNLRLM